MAGLTEGGLLYLGVHGLHQETLVLTSRVKRHVSELTGEQSSPGPWLLRGPGLACSFTP